MDNEEYGLTQKGAEAVVGIVSSLCHGYSLEQAAALNGLHDEDSVKVILYMLLAQAGLVLPVGPED